MTPAPTGPIIQSPNKDRVLIVYNEGSAQSREVAQYYQARRSIPAENLCPVTFSDVTGIGWPEYASTVRPAILGCLNQVGKDKILYIVMSYLTPYLVGDIPVDEWGMWGAGLALDQNIADIYHEGAYNPYKAMNSSRLNIYTPFMSLADFRTRNPMINIFSVWRLEGPDMATAKGLVDKALYAESNGLKGIGCIDRNRGWNLAYGQGDGGYLVGDWDLYRAAEFIRLQGFRVMEDGNEAEFGSAPAPSRCENAALYGGWYSLNNYNDAFTWAPGAIGAHYDSGSAANPRGGTNWSAGAIRNGITVTSGAVYEPYLEGMAAMDGVFRNLFEGANVGDAFLRNTFFLRWMIINMGDPLYTPFPNSVYPPPAAPLPPPWMARDIGPMGIPGSTVQANGSVAVTASGNSLSYTEDNMQFASRTLTGDGEIVARVDRVEFTYYGSSGGLMVRESDAPGSKFVQIAYTPEYSAYFGALRSVTGGNSRWAGTAEGRIAGAWLRIQRRGDVFTTSYSYDKFTWTTVSTETVAMPLVVQFGVFAYAATNDLTNTVIFSDLTCE